MTRYLISALVVVMMAIGGGVYAATNSTREKAFRHNVGAYSYGIRIVPWGRPSDEHTIVQSGDIDGIRWIGQDTVVVALRTNSYRISHTRSGIVMIRHVAHD